MSCSGCFVTALAPVPPDDAYLKLARTADQLLAVEIESSGYDSATIGYQFVLGIVPICRVQVDSMNSLLQGAAYQEFAERGIRVVDSPAVGAHRLRLTVTATRANGFDLLVVREPFAEVAVHGVLLSAAGEVVREARGHGTARDFSAFAFERELQQVLTRASVLAVADLADRLGFPRNENR